MLITFIFTLLLYHQVICINFGSEKTPLDNDFLCSNNYIESSVEENSTIEINPGLAQTYFIQYLKDTKFVFNITNEKDNLQINIHGINCNFKMEFQGELINKNNLDTYSLIINSTNNNITISPLIDATDGEYKENYEQKSCPLSINSYLITNKKPTLIIENRENNIFHLKPSYYKELSILYNLKEVLKDSFINLVILYNEKANFSIDVTYIKDGAKNNSLSKYIYNSTNIYLNSDFLLYNEANVADLDGILYITIKNIDEKEINMYFKVIEKDSISILEKNALNFGFLTSKTTYQYYYTEISYGEEGELVLHNKRLYGVLYGKIIQKNEINKNELNNISIYPKEYLNETNTTYLEYNQHSLQLKYYDDDTSNCFDGCYLLITYEQKKSKDDFPLIGYEFTILSRSWNYTDYISQIIDIPYNEFIIGLFEKGSVSHHYYAISLPDDADKIIIQLEGNYLDGFYGEGRKKLNTIKTKPNTKKLEIISNKNVLTLNLKDLNLKERNISFAFRPKDYFAEILSFYYFRVLYLKKDDKLFFPIDSDFGNLCIPEIDIETNFYNCYLIYNNNLNLLSTKFAVTSSTQNEFFKIYATKVYKDGTTVNIMKQFLYIDDSCENDIDYYIFRMEFLNNETKNIMTSFYDSVTVNLPQIYSNQMFYIDLIEKLHYFRVKNSYTLNYKYINGYIGYMNVSFLNFHTILSTRNYRGKPIALPIDSETDKISVQGEQSFLYFFQLDYNMNNKGIEEIKSGETKSQFIIDGYFPFYYYLKIKNKTHINVDINIRLNSYNETLLENNFEIKGYILNEDKIKRKINGEYIRLEHPIKGYYSHIFKVGLLQVNQKIENENNYLLIEIQTKNQVEIISYLLVELVTKENNDDYFFIPINQYIIETFDGENNETRRENKYYLSSSEKYYDQVLIELSSGYKDIEIVIENTSNSFYTFEYFNGFNKYRVFNATDDNVYFKVINPKKRAKANYMIRYYYTGIGAEYDYILDLNGERNIISQNEENTTISLTFKGIKINYREIVDRNDIYFYIFGILYKTKENSEELVNTTCILNERTPLYEDSTKHIYSLNNPENWKLVFKDIPRKENYIYELQIQVNAILEDSIFNEMFLVYTTKVDLTDLGIEEENNYLGIILGIVIGLIVAILIAFSVIKYIRLRKKNKNLQEEMKSIAYSNDIKKNVLKKEKNIAQRDEDYESTFI